MGGVFSCCVEREVTSSCTDREVASFESLPDTTMSFILSFLHCFNLVGHSSRTCKCLAAACSNHILCQHVLERDFGQEELQGLPLQVLRVSVHIPPPVRRPISLQDLLDGTVIGNDHGNGPLLKIRSIVNGLCHKSYHEIGHLAASEGRPALLQWAGYRCDLNHVDGDLSALMVSSAANHPSTTAEAVKFCSLEQQRNRFGTALHQAAYTGAAASCVELLRAKASLESRNGTYSQTPLHVACSRNHGEVVRLFLEAHPDVSLQDKDGLTAFRIASMMRSAEVVQIFEQYEREADARR